MWMLGISAYYHDSAASLIKNGTVVAAAEEERFNRVKHYKGFPEQAVVYCLAEANISLHEIEFIVFFEKPFLKFERILETYHAFAPKGIVSFVRSMPIWLKDKLYQKQLLIKSLNAICSQSDISKKLLFSEHHLSHAASAFYPSPFDSALIVVLDGVGEWATTSVMEGRGNQISLLKKIEFPHSIGLLYSSFTYFCGFKVNSDEYKLMGLAPYGKPNYVNVIKENLISIADDGSFQLNMNYFDFCTGLTMTNRRFERLFGRTPRSPDSEITQMDMDLARSIQEVLEEVVLKLCQSLQRNSGHKNLCLAGGVALNCVANGRLLRESGFEQLWIQPAAGDSGASLGAALAGYHLFQKAPRSTSNGCDQMHGSYLGPEFSGDDIEVALQAKGISFYKLEQNELIARAAHAIADEKVIGWFQGRMEFGPRALGNRSILGDPRSSKTQSVMNKKIKFRESFRPFAPSVLMEDACEYFDIQCDSPYMLLTAYVKDTRRITGNTDRRSGLSMVDISRSDIPAVTHIDYSARLQTVTEEGNPLFYCLIKEFKRLTGYALLVNSSFNIRDEPIVCNPTDAVNCFLKTDMDELYIGNYRVVKEDQAPL